MLVGFFDGSPDDNNYPTVMVVAGFIAPDHIWDTVIDEWRKIIQNPKYPTRLRCFHATECVNGEDEVKNWTFADRLGLWGELVDLLIDSSLVGVGTVMNCEHYNRLDDAMKARLHSPHHFLVEAAIQFGIGVARNEGDQEQLSIIFDSENKPTARESYLRYLNYQQDKDWSANFVGAGQLSSFEALPLQAADLLAYGTYRYFKKQYYPDNTSDYFPIGPAFERLSKNIENIGGIYEDAALKNIADQIRKREDIPL
jgi:hypothetical protein